MCVRLALSTAEGHLQRFDWSGWLWVAFRRDALRQIRGSPSSRLHPTEEYQVNGRIGFGEEGAQETSEAKEKRRICRCVSLDWLPHLLPVDADRACCMLSRRWHGAPAVASGATLWYIRGTVAISVCTSGVTHCSHRHLHLWYLRCCKEIRYMRAQAWYKVHVSFGNVSQCLPQACEGNSVHLDRDSQVAMPLSGASRGEWV